MVSPAGRSIGPYDRGCRLGRRGAVMAVILALLALVSAGLSLIGYGLSAMASDDISRPLQARMVQLLQLAWFFMSIATPIVALWIARYNPAAGRMAYIPLALVAASAIAALALY